MFVRELLLKQFRIRLRKSEMMSIQILLKNASAVMIQLIPVY